MAYSKFHENWQNFPSTSTPITAEALEHIEDGIATAAEVADDATTDLAAEAVTRAAADAALDTRVDATDAAVTAEAGTRAAADTALDGRLDTAEATLAGLGDLAVLDEVGVSEINATGTPDGTTFLRGDGAWAAPPGGGGGIVDSVVPGNGMDVDATDAANPIVAIESAITTKLAGIETGADVTDATNVAAAGAVMAIGTLTKIEGPITQAAYDALTPDADTLYVIVG